MSFWSGESLKQSLPIDVLQDTYATVEFGSDIELVHQCPIDDSIREFLEKHYDDNMPDMMRWLLDTSSVASCLLHKKSRIVIAFMCGLVFPVNVPFYSGNVLIGTLLCVHPLLRKTGLVQKFLSAVMKESARCGHKVRVSTTPDVLALQHCGYIKRYVLRPSLHRPTFRHMEGPPSSSQSEIDAVCSYIGVSTTGIDWLYTKAHPSLFAYLDTDFGGLFLKVNRISYQLLAVRKEASCEKPMVSFLNIVANNLRASLVIDAWDESFTGAELEHSSRIPGYYIYFHNVSNIQPALYSIPMI